MARRRFGLKAELYEVVHKVREHFEPACDEPFGPELTAEGLTAESIATRPLGVRCIFAKASRKERAYDT